MYKSVASSTFTMLCNHHHYLVPVTPCSSLPQCLATTDLLSVSMDLSILGTSYRRNHTMLAFCVWFRSLTIMFSRFIHVIACIGTHPFLWLDNILLFVCATFCLSILQPMDIRVVFYFWLFLAGAPEPLQTLHPSALIGAVVLPVDP